MNDRETHMKAAERIIKQVETALQKDDEAAATAALKRVSRTALSAEDSRRLAILARSFDRNDLALRALVAGPVSQQATFLALQLRTEAGEAVADELAALLGSAPPASQPLLQLIGALEVEGRSSEAIQLLENAVRQQPAWLEGHQALAQLRFQAGEADPARSFADALSRDAANELLLGAWLGTVSRTCDWSRFERIAAETRRRCPGSVLIATVCADGFSEMGRQTEADQLFQQLARVADPQLDAARMRHAMRYRRFGQAIDIGERAVATHGAAECWAWLGAAWRLSDDPRSDWFHRGSELIAAMDLDYSPADLNALAQLLHGLHRASGPPLGQSPRQGTQTPGPLLKRAEPEIRQLRRKMRHAVRRYIGKLPAMDPRHPFLGRPRRAFRFEGAWSIRLRPAGCHVSHIHSRGWISSAFYVELPDGMSDSPQQQGWLQFGVPLLPEGEPTAEPLKVIAPRRARLALFPSVFWHGTRPFDHGERLTVAFDVVPR